MKIKLLLIFIFQFACIMEIKDQNNDAMVISNFNVEYDQIINEIFFQLTTPLNHDLIERVYVKMIKDDLSNELVFTLNDLGTSGDIIASNGIFSGIFSFQEGLSFGKYEVEAIIENISGEYISEVTTFSIEEQFPPEIMSIKFWKKNKQGQGYEFDPETTEFQINDDDSSYLDIQVEIKDLNGKNDIDFIRYQINVEGMSAADSCDYVPESGFQSYVQWYLDFQSTTDSTFIFDINNQFLAEPGIPIKPITSCGKTGVSIFKFIVSDYFHDAIVVEVPLAFIKCGDNLWDCNVGDESNYCIQECSE